jgi:hypothetical protein
MRTAEHTSGGGRGSTRRAPRPVGRVRSADTTPGEVARTMRALRDAGLVENTGGPGLAEERWRLTARGREILPLLERDA